MAKPDTVESKLNPTAVYNQPSELISAPLSIGSKLEILKNWEDEEIQLQKATDESMTGGEPSRLAEVRRVIDLLKNENHRSAEL